MSTRPILQNTGAAFIYNTGRIESYLKCLSLIDTSMYWQVGRLYVIVLRKP
ncbi:hypothetical protein [Chryseobacterium sp. ISL-6]|uniref:hypothetical protein n=1 Tax=Chryseobacterium sp. ISL-6 TaxID=2819143 RepID=UPI002034D06A|nr:hypothetical protein [Chryseobacterium sp. ISL-6]